jgi:hypothetical protein
VDLDFDRLLGELGKVGEAFEELRLNAPSMFPGEDIERYTGGRWIWPTVQNKRYRREIPADAFIYSGRRVLIHRDAFFRWWLATLSASKPPLPGSFKKRRPRRRLRKAAVRA